jgi:hypothetical protein
MNFGSFPMITASEIRDHMEVLASDGRRIGKVDHIAGENRIRLTKGDSFDGHHHLIPLDWVESVDEKVHLHVTASEALNNWEDDEEEDEAAGAEERQDRGRHH